MIADILATLRERDTVGPWHRAFAWTKPKAEAVPGGTCWTFYGRRSAAEPEGIGRIFVRLAEGEKLLSVTCGATWWVDLRTEEETVLDSIKRRLEREARVARAREGMAILAEEAEARQRRVVPGQIILVHGDAVVIGSKWFRVWTVRGWALEQGRDPGAALAENARRKAANEKHQDPDRGNEWFPSWSPLAALSPCRGPIRVDAPYCTARLIAGAQVTVEGILYHVTGRAEYPELEQT